MNKIIIIAIIIVVIFLLLAIIRALSPKEIDDVSPEISCEEIERYNPDILWVIPKFNNKPASENKEWCKYILSLNKTIGMHGVTHEYHEFETDRNQEYIQEGIDIFEKCFGFKPKMFKAPQLKISQNNIELIKKNNLELKGRLNQYTRKVYHCEGSQNPKLA
ncbi:MAG: DUF2334 domain-containing protein [Nanoarchaeota archaeon]|nr:DUF2334 domain-containing protein [Nanoarchaeota archaeon]